MFKKARLIILGLLISLFIASPIFAGQAIRVGMGVPQGIFGEYEYKILLDQVGLFAGLGSYDGSVSSFSGGSTNAKISSWTIGARYYIPLIGIHIKGGYSGMTVDGKVANPAEPTLLTVDATAEVTGLDLGIGYEIGLGPVFIGIDGGVILAKPSVTTSPTPVVGATGGLFDVFNVESVPYAKVFVGIKF
ncbi:hypothetical protein ACFL2K_02605 [Candidatus Margulisiibacteriota bacterium]